MRLRLAGIAVLAVLAAGCGGGSSSDPAQVVPADALAYGVANTDTGSSQITSARAVLAKFPFESKLYADVTAGLQKEGIDAKQFVASLGPQVAVAAVRAQGTIGAVGFAKPSDAKTFDAVLAKSPQLVHETIDGWTVFSEKQALLDAVKNRSGSLAGSDDYSAAFGTLPSSSDALARGFVSGAGIKALGVQAVQSAGSAGVGGLNVNSFAKTPWVAAALSSSDGALELELHTKKTSSSTSAGSASLAGQIPSGAIVALSESGAGGVVSNAGITKALAALPAADRAIVTPLLRVLGGPLIAYVRPGTPLPEVTIATKPSNAVAALVSVGVLIRNLTGGAKPVLTKVDGGSLFKVTVGGAFGIYYGTWNGQIVVTDSPDALAALGGSDGRLTDDQVFEDAKKASGLPDDNNFLFVDVQDLLPVVDGLAQLAGEQIPPGVEKNLKPLRSVLVYGSRDGDVESGVVYLATS